MQCWGNENLSASFGEEYEGLESVEGLIMKSQRMRD